MLCTSGRRARSSVSVAAIVAIEAPTGSSSRSPRADHTPAHMRPGLSTPFGSKLSFTRARQCRERARLRAEHRHHGADRRRRTDQHGMAAARLDRVAHDRFRRRPPTATAQPRSTRPPSRRGIRRRCASRCGASPPRLASARSRCATPRSDARRTVGGERFDIADRAPERARLLRVVSARQFAPRRHQLGERCARDARPRAPPLRCAAR